MRVGIIQPKVVTFPSYNEHMFNLERMYSRVALCSNRYEDEINKRAAAENEFVLLKKVQIHQDGPCLFVCF